MTPLEILIAAREKIADPEKWTREALARDSNGKRCEPTSPNAVSWCAQGSAVAVSGGVALRTIKAALTQACRRQFPRGDWMAPIWPGDVNDEKGHAAVMEMFDRAIEIEREVAPIRPTGRFVEYGRAKNASGDA